MLRGKSPSGLRFEIEATEQSQRSGLVYQAVALGVYRPESYDGVLALEFVRRPRNWTVGRQPRIGPRISARPHAGSRARE